MSLINYKILFWDFDGVIKESFSVKTDAFVELFKPYGKVVFNKVKKHHINNAGMSRFDKIPLYLKWSGIKYNKIKIDEMCLKFSDLVKNKVINSAWVPGVKVFLKKNKKTCRNVIVSATPQSELEDICKSLNIFDYFSEIYGAPTTKSYAIKTCMQLHKIPPEKCLMFGDALADIKAAKKNNINFIFRRHEQNQSLRIDNTVQVIDDFNNFHIII